jgi:hypothetical protein
VTHVLLDHFQTDTRFEQMCGVRVPQGLHTLLINSVPHGSFTDFIRSSITKSR